MNETMNALLDALADALAERLAERIPRGGQPPTYTAAQLAERYSMSKSSIQRLIRAGEFGETINTGPRTHLVTAEGVRQFESAHTAPAHKTQQGKAIRRRGRHIDPGPI